MHVCHNSSKDKNKKEYATTFSIVLLSRSKHLHKSQNEEDENANSGC